MPALDTILFQRDPSPEEVQHPEQENDFYNYTPSKVAGIIFVALYAITTLTHTFQATRYRAWWLFPTIILAGVGEVVGWSGRLWSSFEPAKEVAFQIQICCTIIAPTPLIAANFIILGRLVERLGSEYSRLKPRLYSIIFLSADVVALCVQALGGGLAATASDRAGSERGGNIMLGGIAFQLVMMVLFIICGTEFFIRYFWDAPHPSKARSAISGGRGALDRNMKMATIGLIFATTVLLIRAVYRTIELADGWNGKIISTQWLFIVFDGVMVVLAMYTFNIAHPGRLLQNAETFASDKKPKMMQQNFSIALDARPRSF